MANDLNSRALQEASEGACIQSLLRIPHTSSTVCGILNTTAIATGVLFLLVWLMGYSVEPVDLESTGSQI